MRVFSAQSADSVWRKAAGALLQDRQAAAVASRAGPTRELLHCALLVKDPRQRWVVSRRPALNVAFALAEVVWILSGSDDVAFLSHWNTKYPRFVGTSGRAHGAYGARLRSHFGIDQLDRARRTLEREPESRQVVLEIWSASEDLPFATGRPRAGDIPCNVLACLRIAKGKLQWMQVCRSNDMFLGLPHNLVQFTYLQEVIAGWLGIDVGEYLHAVSSLHLYEHDRSTVGIETRQPHLPKPSDARLPWTESRKGWRRLALLARRLVRRRSFPRGPQPSSSSLDLPQTLADIYQVLAAEDARRRGRAEEAEVSIDECRDRTLQVLWRRWTNRVSARFRQAQKARRP